MAINLSYLKAGYRSERWKWVLSLEDRENLLSNPQLIVEKLSNTSLLQTYGLDKPPKILPCRKKCNANPWCLSSASKESKSVATRLTEQLRDMSQPVGLQNTANTCWINSALQALFHLNQFRNCINSIDGFEGEDSLNSLEFLLQAIFVEMELHKNKALACSPDSVFEKLASFVTKEVMQKDQDYEVLKCVSEFLENTIDSLLGNPRTGPRFSSIFKTTVYRIAKWKCTSCQKEHARQLPPDTCYTMAAYVSADECPLDQCILDLQTETQTGVSLVCGGEDGVGAEAGCGATVKVDRVVTPQILSLPSLLIIRNNSLIDREIKRRLHVVYPETLDLTSHTCNLETASFSLRAVIYHHGHWIKHFSAHVKTEDGKWFDFNDEKVSGLVSRPGSCNPLETHKDYFSLANVANKYKRKPGVRVSRGAFIWIYERSSVDKAKSLLQPPNTVIDHVLAKQKNKLTTDIRLIEKVKEERVSLYNKLSVEDINDDFSLISQPLLNAWSNFGDVKFVPQPSVLAEGMCEHMKFSAVRANNFKCVRSSQVDTLVTADCGIHTDDEKIPVIFKLEDAVCTLCVSRHAHHILFRENLKELHKRAKKETSKESIPGTTFIGTTTLANWAKMALGIYMKETGLEETEASSDEESEGSTNAISDQESAEGNKKEDDAVIENHKEENHESEAKKCSSNGDLKDSLPSTKENGVKENGEDNFTYFNEDIVCCHNMVDPKVCGVWLPNDIAAIMKKLCTGLVHPALRHSDIDLCPHCQFDMDKTLETCSNGRAERKVLYHLFVERKRPHSSKDTGKPLFILSREFLVDWKAFVRMCMKEDQEICRPKSIINSDLLCKHQKLLYPCTADSSLFDFAVLLTEEEWNYLRDFYSYDHSIQAEYTEEGKLVVDIGVCEEGCVEEEATRIYEDQFSYEYELINIRQVNSVSDVPSVDTCKHDTADNHADTEETQVIPAKKPRLASSKDTSSVASLRTASKRLVRASKTFSSLDTIKEIQNFIADRTGIWPLLQTLWLSGGKEHGNAPLLLSDKHRSMTLNALRIKPGDTIYFRAAVEDLEKAAGDGETEYSEIEPIEEA